ncbi:PQ loop repeat-domain-containing protein [Sordaria brevicollis]|uniref:PQ loop repeat-domain-containing protein n=1 Tax=Sordaria brevicollis TaxID=83679 RepID=A0AAE0NWQ4_SORBR|nr:PQ loop repeat-domain-containing protein [Sordaria brevicollis]
MAPQTDIPVAANVLGTIGTVLWCVQLIPQIWTNWRTKETTGLPGSMMFLWALCGVPFGVYAIAQSFNIPLQVQPQVFMALCLINWTQILVYGSKWPLWKASLLSLVIACVFAGVEAALILTLKPIYNRGNETPIFVIGVIAAILLAAGLLPPYGEMYKRHGRVVGINWIFLGMDWSGAFFSLMAVVTQNTFDVMGGVLYILCAVLELGIFGSHLIWLARTRRLRKRLKQEGRTFDEVLEEKKKDGEEWRWADREVPDLKKMWLKVWKRDEKEKGREETDLEKQEQAEGGRDQSHLPNNDGTGIIERDLEKQKGGTAGQELGNNMLAEAETQKHNGSEENTGASTPTMVNEENGREVSRT